MSESNGDFWARAKTCGNMERNPSRRSSQQLFDYNAGARASSSSQVLRNNNMPMTMNEDENGWRHWTEIFPSKEKGVDQRLLNTATGMPTRDVSFMKNNYRVQSEAFQNIHQGEGGNTSRISFNNIPSANEVMPARTRTASNNEQASSFSAHSNSSSNTLVDELKSLLTSNAEVRKAVLDLYQNPEDKTSKSTKSSDNKEIDNERRISSVKETRSSLYERRNVDSNEFVGRPRRRSRSRSPFRRRRRSSSRSPVRRRRRSSSRSPVRRRRRSRSRSPVRRRVEYMHNSSDGSRSSDKSTSHERHSKDWDRKDLKRRNEEKFSVDHVAKISKIIDEKSIKLEPRTETSAAEFGYNTQFSQPPPPYLFSAVNHNATVVSRPNLSQPITSAHGNFLPMWQVNYQQLPEAPRLIENIWDYCVPPPPLPTAPCPTIPSFKNEFFNYETKHPIRASTLLANAPLDGKSITRITPKISESISELPGLMNLALDETKVTSESKKSQVQSKTSFNKSGTSNTVGKLQFSKPPAIVKLPVIQLNLTNKKENKNKQLTKKSTAPSESPISSNRLKNMRKKMRKKFNIVSCMYCGCDHIGRIDSLSYAIVKKISEADSTRSSSGNHNVNASNEKDNAVGNSKDDEIVVTGLGKNVPKKNVEVVNISDDEHQRDAIEEKTGIEETETEKLEDISRNEEKICEFHDGDEDEFILLEEVKETDIEEISLENEVAENLESAGTNDEDFDIKEDGKVTASIIIGVLDETISPVMEIMGEASIDVVGTSNICESLVENISEEDEMASDAKSLITKDKLHEILEQGTEKEMVTSGNQENAISDNDQKEANENDDNSNDCEILEEVAFEEKREEPAFIPIVKINGEKCENEKGSATEDSKSAFYEFMEVDGNCDERAYLMCETLVNEEAIKLNENSSEDVVLVDEEIENSEYYLSEDDMEVLERNIVDTFEEAEKAISVGGKIEVIEDTEESGRSKERINNNIEKDVMTKSSSSKELLEQWNELQIEREESEVCESQAESPSQGSRVTFTVDSDLALDHFVAGSFQKAMQLLHQQVGIINFVPYKSIIEKCVIATIEMTPEMPSYSGKTALKLSFNMEEMVKRLQLCYKSTTLGNFEKATLLFRQLLRDILLMKIDSKRSVAKAKMLIKICRNYITCFLLVMKKEDLIKNDFESEKRVCELAAYATNCTLQPVHQILSLRIANSLFFKIGNYKTAAVFAKKILEAKVHPEIAERTKKMLTICEKTPVDRVVLDYDCEKSFVICAGSLTPTFSWEAETTCPLCQASYMPYFKGSLCKICNLAQVGKVCSGLKLIIDSV